MHSLFWRFAICDLWPFLCLPRSFFKDLEFFFSCMYLFIHFFWKLGLLNANSERFLVYSFNYRKELRLCLSFLPLCFKNYGLFTFIDMQ